jgi:hypothetical protein
MDPLAFEEIGIGCAPLSSDDTALRRASSRNILISSSSNDPGAAFDANSSTFINGRVIALLLLTIPTLDADANPDDSDDTDDDDDDDGDDEANGDIVDDDGVNDNDRSF